MRRLLTAVALAPAIVLAGNTYLGEWATNQKVYGNARVVMTGNRMDGYIYNAFVRTNYRIQGTVSNRVFTGTLTSNGKTYACTGRGTYGTRAMNFYMTCNGVNFVLYGNR